MVANMSAPMPGTDDLENAFDRLAARRARLRAVARHHHTVQSSRFGALRTVYQAVRTLFRPTGEHVSLAYTGVAPFPMADAATTSDAAGRTERNPLATYVDRAYYLRRNPDIARAGLDPVAHYLARGAAENRDAHPMFDPHWYVARYPEAARHPHGAIGHYVERGVKDRHWPHPAFDAPRYATATGCAGDPLVAYLHAGPDASVDPHPLFDGTWYRGHCPGLQEPPLLHFLRADDATASPHPLFDSVYYREHSPDVADAALHPFVHYLTAGHAEGRRPNPYFDPDWYRETYADVGTTGIDPLVHYVEGGWREGRNPSPAFRTAWYAATYLAHSTSTEPLAHYLHEGRSRGNHATPFDDPAAYRPPTAVVRPAIERAIDVIVPVYRGLEQTRRCIESVRASALPEGTRLVVIDDCSPEPALREYVASLAATDIVALRNETNVGFVGTVNRGMALDPSRDVVLLNSDTIVANDWLRRLGEAAYRDRIATVTPFSNNATICSFPRLGDNPFSPRDVTRTDDAARTANAGRVVDLPTGVGFCLYIRRDALAALGSFDQERFGKGYGEEVDFCRRAAKAGFRNVLTTDVFVYHEGEVSFAAGATPAKARAETVVRAAHPEYARLVAEHVALDPAAAHRLALSIAAVRARRLPVVLFVTHALGGGIARHVDDLRAQLNERATVLRLTPTGRSTIRLDAPDLDVVAPFDALGDVQDDVLADVLTSFGIDFAHIHSTIGFPIDLERFMRRLGLPFAFTVHDFHTLCPQTTMTDAEGRYCGELGDAACDACIALRPRSEGLDIESWRDRHAWIYRDADRVIAPSQDAAERVRRYHPDTHVLVVPHEQ